MTSRAEPPRERRLILLVEDDPSLARGLSFNLEREGYDLLRVVRGDEAIEAATQNPIDLMILDLGLPDMDGTQVLEEIRRRGVNAPVICLSARSSEADVVMGLSLGADDYITKPFGLSELLARIAVRLRRTTTDPPPSILQLEGACVDWEARTVRRGSESQSLTPIESDLLRYLVERAGKAVPREELLMALWGVDHRASTRTLDNHLARLRRKVEKDAALPRHLITAHGVGYRFDP